MDYAASVADFFKSPKWGMNLLLGGVCILIPLIGFIVITGWLVTGFWSRQDEDFQTFPPFEFSAFDKYLERGLWPFLVPFVVNLLMVPLTWALMIPLMLAGVFASGNDSHVGSGFALIVMPVGMLGFALLWCAVTMIMVPLTIRATLTQDFVQAFNLAFIKRFLALTWKEVVLSTLFLIATGMLFACVGLLVFCVGVYFAAVLNYFAKTHLDKQLYALYLRRGGEPIPPSAKLSDTPPALTAA